jgi:ATP-dependent RNA helicase DDX27
MLKAAIKHGSSEDQARHRTVPPDVVSKWSQTLESLKDEVSGVLRDEKQEKQVGGFHACSIPSVYILWMVQLQQAEMELRKGENMMKHEAEIYSRPARTWFQTGNEKQKSEGLVICITL